jgi:hypothetical protein
MQHARQSMTALWVQERAQRCPGGHDAEEENDEDGSGEIIMSSS